MDIISLPPPPPSIVVQEKASEGKDEIGGGEMLAALGDLAGLEEWAKGGNDDAFPPSRMSFSLGKISEMDFRKTMVC